MRIVGLILVVFCFSLAGFWMTDTLSRRVRLLEQGRLAVQKIRYELLLTKAASLRVLQMTQHQGQGIQGFQTIGRCIALSSHMPFPDAWRQAVTETLGALSESEREIFERVGEILGSSDLHHQEEGLLLCEAQLGECISSAKEKLRTHGRLYNGLWVLTGLMVAVILI